MTRQILRHVSDRTGIISFANFPLIWLFGMRNNVLLWLTGWDFGTYNNFHRWVARVATVQAVIHSIGYTALIFKGEAPRARLMGVTLLTGETCRRWMGLFCLLVDILVLVGGSTGASSPRLHASAHVLTLPGNGFNVCHPRLLGILAEEAAV